MLRILVHRSQLYTFKSTEKIIFLLLLPRRHDDIVDMLDLPSLFYNSRDVPVRCPRTKFPANVASSSKKVANPFVCECVLLELAIALCVAWATVAAPGDTVRADPIGS